jgi:hypothetical protein
MNLGWKRASFYTAKVRQILEIQPHDQPHQLIDNDVKGWRLLLPIEELAASAHMMLSLKTAQMERLRSQESSFPEVSINSAGKPGFHP